MKRLGVVLVATTLLAGVWQGCASRTATRVPGPGKAIDFTQCYDVVKYLISTDQAEKAASQLKKLERKAKTDVEKAMISDARASLHLARREFVSAEEDASTAIRVCPSLVSAYRVRVLARRERGNLSGAIRDLESVLVLEPSDTESLRGLAEILIDQDEISKAVTILERFLQADSLDAKAQDAWCSSMASLLGFGRFPIEYLRTLKTDALNRGELAAVLVVELEMARMELEGPAESGVPSESHASEPKDSSDSAMASRDTVSPLNYTELRSRLKARQLVDLRPNRPATPSNAVSSLAESVDSLRSTHGDSYAHEKRTQHGSVPIPDCARFWFAPFADKAVSLGLLKLYPDGTFRPSDIARKGVVTVELCSFLSRHCSNALTVVQNELAEPLQSAEARVSHGSSFEGTTSGGTTASGYYDVDDSSYLWRPVAVVTTLGIMRPASRDSFGIDSPLSGQETKAIARALAGIMASSECKTSD